MEDTADTNAADDKPVLCTPVEGGKSLDDVEPTTLATSVSPSNTPLLPATGDHPATSNITPSPSNRAGECGKNTSLRLSEEEGGRGDRSTATIPCGGAAREESESALKGGLKFLKRKLDESTSSPRSLKRRRLSDGEERTDEYSDETTIEGAYKAEIENGSHSPDELEYTTTPRSSPPHTGIFRDEEATKSPATTQGGGDGVSEDPAGAEAFSPGIIQ